MKLVLLFLSLLSTAAYSNPISFTKENWSIIEYTKIKPNNVILSHKKAIIKVANSAGSILHTFPTPKKLNSLSLKLSHRSNLSFKNSVQGSRGSDDYILRIGVIYEGNKTLGFLERQFAAKWLINIFDKAPKGSGLSQVYFYNVVSSPSLLGKKRVSSSSKYFYEDFKFISIKDNDSLDLKIKLDNKKPIIGIWLCFDGDDTGSSFEADLENLVIK
jgi:hypothetical protein